MTSLSDHTSAHSYVMDKHATVLPQFSDISLSGAIVSTTPSVDGRIGGGKAGRLRNFPRMLHFLLFAVCAVNLERVATSLADQPATIWGRPIMRQPFDREQPHEICTPDWVRHTLGVGYTLSVQSPPEREKAVAAGVTISELGFVDPLFVYYDSKYLHRRSPHVAADHLEKEVAAYRQLGLRILAVYPPSLQGEVYESHPEWRRIDAHNGPVPQVDLRKHPSGGMLCLLGPYGDFMIDVVSEIVTKFGVDAFSFDGLHYGGVCYCRHCRDGFRSQAGSDIPPVNLDDRLFRRYQHWADRRLEDLVRRMQSRIKAIKPDVALVTWTTNAGRFGHFRDIPRNMPARMNLLLDAPDQEFWLDETNRGASVVPAFANAYAWAVTNHRVAFSEPYLMSHGNPYGKDSFPPHEVLRRMLLCVAHGSTPSIAVAQPPVLREAVFHGLAEVQRRKRWLTHKEPEPWAAIVMSDNSRVFYGRSSGAVEQRYLAHVFGTFRAVVEAHMPFTLINDWNLNEKELAPYRVLVLPNTACLDAAQTQAIRSFVEQGGGLVATGDTSLCDEFGDPRQDFALSDVFGCSWRPDVVQGLATQPPDVNFARNLDERFWQRRKGIFELRLKAGSELDEPRLRQLVGAEPVAFKGQSVAVHVDDTKARTIAVLSVKGGSYGQQHPAIVVGRHGKGRVVYFAAGVDAAYYTYPYPYQRILLERAMRWAAPEPPKIEVDAPMCVHATAMRQRLAGERLLIHLFNDVNTTAFHALPDDDVPLREETVPIHNIRVTVRDYSIGRIHLEPDGIEFPMQALGDGKVAIVVPRLDIHAVVVIELR